MKQVELSIRDRVALGSLLERQRGTVKRLKPFSAVVDKLKITEAEKKAVHFEEVTPPNGQNFVRWNGAEAAALAPEKFLIETPDAEACVELLKSDALDVATGDLDWILRVLPQLEAPDTPVQAVP